MAPRRQRPFPGTGGPWQISVDGGSFPVWSKVRSELYFGAPDLRVMRVKYEPQGSSFRLVERPTPWTTTRYQGVGVGRPYDLHPDGLRFAIKPEADEGNVPEVRGVVVVLNFLDELSASRRRADSARRRDFAQRLTS